MDEREVTDLLRCFSLGRLRAQIVGLGLCESDVDDRELARLYFSGRCRMISPNEFFDEVWYVEHYPDVAGALRAQGLISGFIHFIKHGMRLGLWPNKVLFSQAQACAVPGVPKTAIDEADYLSRYPAAAAFIAAFPMLGALEHYNLYGRFLGFFPDTKPARPAEALSLRVAEAEFDPAFYVARYLTDPEDRAYHQNPFEHYVKFGMRAAYSPNSWFDEQWYRAFYKEVREGIENGWLPSGFYHYILTGRIEGRLPKHDLTAALELRMPGVTDPALMGRTEMLKKRLAGLRSLPLRSVRARPAPTIWILLPTLNPDIMYGGYKAAIALICALHRDGKSVALVCLEEDPNAPYFLWSEKSPGVRSVFSTIPILGLEEFSRREIGGNDLFMAYTVWDLVVCAQLAGLTDNPTPLLLAQEYEPIFYDCGAQRALCEACYRIPHYPIFNSRFLQSYFEKNRLGIFSGRAQRKPGEDYLVFEHRINRLPLQSSKAMRTRRHRVMVIYARPEAHAARNLFEAVLIALQSLCSRGAFGPEWRFIGLGALSRIPPIPLGGGHELRLQQKISEEEYRRIVSEVDIGVSLMYAPHPSVVPFELATTGALVVTNTYENRSGDDLRGICANIVPCDISIESIVEAIERAISMIGSFARRERQALRPDVQSWDEIFSHDFISAMLGAVQACQAAQQPRVAEFLPAGRVAVPAARAVGRAAANQVAIVQELAS